MRRTSYATQYESDLRRGRGNGAGRDYRPYLGIQDVPSMAVRYRLYLLRFDRIFQLMSYGEKAALLQFEWDDSVINIYEQYALDPNKTIALSGKNEIRHPAIRGEPTVMTTDFLVCYRQVCGVRWVAYQIKYDREDLANQRTKEKIRLERLFWESKNFEYRCVFSTEFNWIFVKNLEELCTLRNSKRLPLGLDAIDRTVKAITGTYPADRRLSTLSTSSSGTRLSDWEVIKMAVAKKLWMLPIKDKPIEKCQVADLQRVRND